MLSPFGGTPADEDKAREMFGTLKPEETSKQIAAAVPFLERNPETNWKIGIVGFCWGGGIINRRIRFRRSVPPCCCTMRSSTTV